MELTHLTQDQLVSAACQGDTDAFGELVCRYEKRIYSFAMGMLCDPDDAFDVSQETFLKAYRSIKLFKGESSFYTWLYTICRNCCYDFLKHKQRHAGHNISLYQYQNGDSDGTVIEIPDHSSCPDRIFNQNQTRLIITEAINSLPYHHKEIIIMRDINQLSYEEIAQCLGISEGTVKSRINRARLKLQTLLKNKL